MSELLQSILPKNTPVFPVYGGSRFLRIFFYFHQTTRRHIQKTAFFMKQQVSKKRFLISTRLLGVTSKRQRSS